MLPVTATEEAGPTSLLGGFLLLLELLVVYLDTPKAEVFNFQELLDSVFRTFAAKAGLFDPAERSDLRRRPKIWRNDRTTDEYRLCYCEDPFGNIIEIYTQSKLSGKSGASSHSASRK